MILPKKPETHEEAWDIIIALVKRINELEYENQELRKALNKDSHNSSKPPSSDGLGKPKHTQSQRTSTGRSVGGQQGHPGTTLKFVDKPDEVIHHTPTHCSSCGYFLHGAAVHGTERRQVFDLPPIAVHVIEHQSDTIKCPNCGKKNDGSFPEGVSSSITYEAGIRSLALYLMNQQLIPYERVSCILHDCFNGCSPQMSACIE